MKLDKNGKNDPRKLLNPQNGLNWTPKKKTNLTVIMLTINYSGLFYWNM